MSTKKLDTKIVTFMATEEPLKKTNSISSKEENSPPKSLVNNSSNHGSNHGSRKLFTFDSKDKELSINPDAIIQIPNNKFFKSERIMIKNNGDIDLLKSRHFSVRLEDSNIHDKYSIDDIMINGTRNMKSHNSLKSNNDINSNSHCIYNNSSVSNNVTRQPYNSEENMNNTQEFCDLTNQECEEKEKNLVDFGKPP